MEPVIETAVKTVDLRYLGWVVTILAIGVWLQIILGIVEIWRAKHKRDNEESDEENGESNR